MVYNADYTDLCLDTVWQCEALHCVVISFSVCTANVALAPLFLEDFNNVGLWKNLIYTYICMCIKHSNNEIMG